MISRKYGYDVDGVLAGFYETVCFKFGILPFPIRKWGDPAIDALFQKIKDDEDFWRGLSVLNGPEKLPHPPAAYITSIPPAMLDARTDWLKSNGFPDAPVVIAQNKVAACKAFGITHFVDDKFSTVRELSKHGVRSYYYTPYYFADDVEGWDYELKIKNIQNFGL